MYMSARARIDDNFSRGTLLSDLSIEPEDNDDNDNNNAGDEFRDEREVPLLADTDAEVEAPAPLVENVVVVDAKEVPADIPQASEVV